MLTKQLPLSSRLDFVPLPADPSIPPTPEQVAAFFGGDINGGLRMLVRAVMENRARQPSPQPTIVPAAAPEGNANAS